MLLCDDGRSANVRLNQIVSRSNHLAKSNRLDGVIAMAIASTCHPITVVNCIHFHRNALSCSKTCCNMLCIWIAGRTSSFRKMDVPKLGTEKHDSSCRRSRTSSTCCSISSDSCNKRWSSLRMSRRRLIRVG